MISDSIEPGLNRQGLTPTFTESISGCECVELDARERMKAAGKLCDCSSCPLECTNLKSAKYFNFNWFASKRIHFICEPDISRSTPRGWLSTKHIPINGKTYALLPWNFPDSTMLLYLLLSALTTYKEIPKMFDFVARDETLCVESCKSPFKRTLFGIIWSCISTIIICAWTSVHPNMPPPNKWKARWNRLRLMFWMIVAPELVLAWAVRQWFAAREIRDAYNERHPGGCARTVSQQRLGTDS